MHYVTGSSAMQSSIQSEPEFALKSGDFREGTGNGCPPSVPDQATELDDV